MAILCFEWSFFEAQSRSPRRQSCKSHPTCTRLSNSVYDTQTALRLPIHRHNFSGLNQDDELNACSCTSGCDCRGIGKRDLLSAIIYYVQAAVKFSDQPDRVLRYTPISSLKGPVPKPIDRLFGRIRHIILPRKSFPESVFGE
jgi:hypothetical protein